MAFRLRSWKGGQAAMQTAHLLLQGHSRVPCFPVQQHIADLAVKAEADLCQFPVMLLAPDLVCMLARPLPKSRAQELLWDSTERLSSHEQASHMQCCSSFCNNFLNYGMSLNMGFAKGMLGRKIALHLQPNRLSSRMSPSYHIQRMEVESGSKKSFFAALVFNVEAIFPVICFLLNI